MKAVDHFEHAEKKFAEGAFLKSIQLYTLAIELDPKNANYISQRGVTFFRLGKHEEALYDLNLSLKLEPDNPYRYSSRAFILSNLNRIEEALIDYEKAVQLDPKDSIAFNNLGLLQEKKGYHKEAKHNFKIADEIEGVQRNLKNESFSERAPDTSQYTNYRDLSYWQFIKRLFSDSKLRSDFIKFLKNGFRIKD